MDYKDMDLSATNDQLIQNQDKQELIVYRTIKSFEELKYSRPLDVHKWSDYKEVSRACNHIYADIEAAGLLEGRYKLDKYKKHLKVVLIDLYVAYLASKDLYIAYSRNKASYNRNSRYASLFISSGQLLSVIDDLHYLGYIEHHSGFYDKQKRYGFQSRIRAYPKLYELMRDFNIDWDGIYIKDIQPIILRDTNKRNREYKDNNQIRRMRKNLEYINNAYRKTDISLHIPDCEYPKLNRILKSKDKLPVDFTRKAIFRVFNNGSFKQGGRLYGGWWQEIPSKYRKYVHINGNPTCELDYAGLHAAILYAFNGITCEGDPYAIEGLSIDRRTVKVAFNILLNAKDRTSATRAIMKENSLNKCQTEQLISALEYKHAEINEYFMTGIGIRLQREDSYIAERIILEFLGAGVLILPVHDSFIVEQDYESSLEKMMHAVYGDYIRNEINVDSKSKQELDLSNHDTNEYLLNYSEDHCDAYSIYNSVTGSLPIFKVSNHVKDNPYIEEMI